MQAMRNATAPAVAIIIPTFNRPDRLRECLDHLARLEDGPYRTVVVDDGSPEPMDAICAPYGDWVDLVRKQNGGPAAARNDGVRAAQGADFVALLDDDCRPHGDWIVKLVEAQGGVRGRLVGGRVDNGLRENVYSAASQTLCSYLYDYYQTSGSTMNFFTSNNIGCLREDYLAHGGFDESFPLAAAEDRDFGIRWQDRGGELIYAPEAVIEHAHALNLRRFWRQHSNYGRGARRLHLTMNERGDTRPKVEAVGFYLGMLLYPFRARSPNPLAETFLIGLSQLAMVAGYAAAVREERHEKARAEG